MDAFRQIRVVDVPSLQATMYELEHVRTGARHLHFACDDPENAFATVVTTVPVDESGAPHVLEHALIRGGGNRYADRSNLGAPQATGGGAWTGWEYTWYNFRSSSHADFLKLVDYQIDYLFDPVLDEETFWKEAHHLEFEDAADPSTPLRIRGVVFNEQKGVFALPLAVSWYAISKALFPGLPYGLEHGGTPRTIPTLTLAQLREFHSRHYHVANARFLTWGDIPLDDLLGTIDSALNAVPSRPYEPTPYPPLVRPTAPARFKGKLPIGASEDPAGRGMVLMGWVTAPVADPYETLLHDLISELLLGSATAPLRAALASSGLGRSVAETFDRYGVRYRDTVLACGLQDVDPADADKVEALVMSTLAQVVDEGIDPALIDSILRNLEFRRRTLAGTDGEEGGGPISLFIQWINSTWIHGGDPLQSLDMEADLARLTAERSTGTPVEDRIRRWLIDNPHRALIVLAPDPGADLRLEEEERADLAARQAALTATAQEEILDIARRLRAHQDARTAAPAIDATAVLDSARRVATPTAVSSSIAGVDVETFLTRTNGITYLDLFADIGDLPDDLWDSLSLFCAAITMAGTTGPAGLSEPAMANRIGNSTGGLSAEVLVPVTGEGDRALRLLRFGGRAFERDQAALVDIIGELLLGADLTPTLVEAVAGQALSHETQGILTETTAKLTRLAGSHTRQSWALRNRLDGFGHLDRLRSLAALGSAGYATEASRLNTIREHIARRGALTVFAAVSGKAAMAELSSPLERLLSSLPLGGQRTGALDDRLPAGSLLHEARIFATPAAFNTEVRAVPGLAHPDAAAIAVAGALLSRWCQSEVGRKGSAYGSGCDAFANPGSLILMTVRDPSVARTFGAYAEGIRRLQEEPILAEELDYARLVASTLANMPQPPALRARHTLIESLIGVGEAQRNAFREALRSLTAADVRQAALAHLGSPGGARASLLSTEMATDIAPEWAFDVIHDA